MAFETMGNATGKWENHRKKPKENGGFTILQGFKHCRMVPPFMETAILDSRNWKCCDLIALTTWFNQRKLMVWPRLTVNTCDKTQQYREPVPSFSTPAMNMIKNNYIHLNWTWGNLVDFIVVDFPEFALLVLSSQGMPELCYSATMHWMHWRRKVDLGIQYSNKCII